MAQPSSQHQNRTFKHQNRTSKQSNTDRHIHTHTNRHIHSLTNGNIKKHLITLAFPLLIGNILQQFYNMTDSIVISHFCDTYAFAAAGISGTVMNLFLFVIGGCCTGISIILASFFGNKDMKNFRKECFISLTFGLIFTIALSITSILALPFILHLIQTPPDIFPYVNCYLNIILGGLSASFLYNLCASILRAIGNTKYALFFLLISIGTNVLLDLILVAGFTLGIAGAAWATVISQLLSAFLCLCYIKKSLPFLLFQKEDLYPDPDLLRQTIRYAAASALHQSSLYIGKLFIQGAVNTLGTESISAYTAAGRIEGLANAFGDSGAESISLFTSQNTGAGNKKRTPLWLLYWLNTLNPPGYHHVSANVYNQRSRHIPTCSYNTARSVKCRNILYTGNIIFLCPVLHWKLFRGILPGQRSCEYSIYRYNYPYKLADFTNLPSNPPAWAACSSNFYRHRLDSRSRFSNYYICEKLPVKPSRKSCYCSTHWKIIKFLQRKAVKSKNKEKVTANTNN